MKHEEALQNRIDRFNELEAVINDKEAIWQILLFLKAPCTPELSPALLETET